HHGARLRAAGAVATPAAARDRSDRVGGHDRMRVARADHAGVARAEEERAGRARAGGMRAGWFALACAAALGCASPQLPAAGTTPPRIAPAPLLPPSAFVHDVQWRQRVSASWPTGTQRFDAALQKRAGELMLVGLSPLGLPGFVLRLRADASLDVENR